MTLDFERLRREPDVEGRGLEASDAADRLILDEASAAIAAATPDTVVVLDDSYGALALGATALGATGVRVHQDLVTGERALARNAARLGFAAERAPRSMPLSPELLDGASVVLLRLPRSLDRLDELAALIAGHTASGVAVFAGGRQKHMSTSMNEVLGAWFERVDVSHARQKSRVLTATLPRPARELVAPAWPRVQHDAALDLDVAAHGGVFAATSVDIGTRLLLAHLDDAMADAATAVDLACGTGVIASWLARARPGLVVTATDRSAAAAASARVTAERNGVGDRVRVTQADGLELLADASEPLVVLNPPFHSDAALHTGIAEHLFADAARVLAPGGELWCVWNSHLRYRSALERIVGPTRQVARDPKFTVTASRRSR
ncbi:class I SAM-dependent methyltransferase [Agromyces salentinus]|uniref:Methyltransferase n=1 Tax=Agromyces salentinus TaxID=269421 RepID=A0ABN2MHQ4_9MICO|nr:methyltransferase [Agromyces salentinus]